MLLLKPLLFLLFTFLFPTSSLAWGAIGHEIVATIAQTNLHPSVRSHLCQILPDFTSYFTSKGEKHCHLAPLAAWPDNVRFRLPWSGHLHYVNPIDDHPPHECYYGQKGWTSEENVLTALTNYTSRLTTLQGSERDIALRFLVHFIGDLHQPLHLTGRNRGGNDIKVHFEGKLSKLHSVWDSQILNKHLRELSNYTTKLPSFRIESALMGKNYDSYIRWILKEGLGQTSQINDEEKWKGWWNLEEQENWLKCPDFNQSFRNSNINIYGNKEFSSSLDHKNLNPNQFVLEPTNNGIIDEDYETKSITDEVDKTDLPICPLHWSKPMHELVCKYAFANPVPKEENLPPYPELDVPEYLGRIDDEKIIQKQLAVAGIRLASILNLILLPEALAFSEK